MNGKETEYFDKKFQDLHDAVLENKNNILWHLRIGSWIVTAFGGALAFLYHKVLGGN